MPKWTKDQEEAIASRDQNLLLAAAAGSGKTAVLVERIIQLIIRDGLDIDRMLIVTFTSAAAGEMRERISEALFREMEKQEGNEKALRRQLNLLNRASISTLHAFCVEVVRSHFYKLDIDPDFRVADSTESELLKQEALEEIFEQQYELADDYFLGLVEMFASNRDDWKLKELVLNAFDFIQSQPEPWEWLREKIEYFNMDQEAVFASSWAKCLQEQFKVQLSGAWQAFNDARYISEESGGPLGYRDAIMQDLDGVERLRKALDKDLKVFYQELQSIKSKRLGRVSKDIDESLKERCKEYRNEGKEILKAIQSDILSKSPEEYVIELNQLYPYMDHLYQLLNFFALAYREKKAEKGIVDFNDLEHYALQILADEAVAHEYQEKYEYIFVDEYQDSNLVQESIITAIERENNLFMVGDVKQSIYRFRLADPTLFLDKYLSFEQEANALNRRIDLSMNFRSRKAILDAINYIFRQIMSRELGEIEYNKGSYLYPGLPGNELQERDALGEVVELCLIEKKPTDFDMNEEEKAENFSDVDIEAKVIAKRIKDLIGREFYDSKNDCYRALEYRDIVVLMRATRGKADLFMETFTSEGIPAYADVNSGYFEALEIDVFMNLLKLIDNKRQDLPLLSIMRSPMSDFQLEELISIRAASKAQTFFEAVEEYIENNDDELKDKLQDFLDRLDRWKNESRYTPMSQFIWQLYQETAYYHYVAAMPGGVQRQANLRLLLDRARQFEGSSIKGLFNFTKFVDRLKSSSGDMGMAKILGENDNVVRIMSIHKSKGLEFPVVILAGTGKKFNQADISAAILFHRDMGIGPRYVDPKLRKYNDTIARIAMKYRIKTENLSEEMRILYVACTRARDKLIISGSVKNLESTAAKWSRSAQAFDLARARSYLDWLGPVIMHHPDGEKLRQLAAADEILSVNADESQWKIEIFRWSELFKQEKLVREEMQHLGEKLLDFQANTHSEYYDIIRNRLNWKYKHNDAVNIPSKLSVSQVKKLNSGNLKIAGMNIPALTKRPGFLAEDEHISATRKGSIVHLLMQSLDYTMVNSRDEIEMQLQTMVDKEILREEEAAVVELDKILEFFGSSLGQRALNADRLYRETPFNLRCKAAELIENLKDSQEEMLIQGVIDLYFHEKDEIVLVDYKTDYISKENRASLIKNYSIQLDLYRQALEKIQGKKVKESYLYFFETAEAILV